MLAFSSISVDIQVTVVEHVSLKTQEMDFLLVCGNAVWQI